MLLKGYQKVAHRGLHAAGKGVPENSLPAFRAAAEAGYAIELDVHRASDGTLVDFHDHDLRRMTGARGTVERMDFRSLRRLRLGGTACTIPLLREVLECVGGRVPLLIELKNGGLPGALERTLVRELAGYRGPVILESFNPLTVWWLRRNAPHLVCGQLACRKYEGLRDGLRAYALRHMLFNCVSRPQFVAYELGGITEKLRLKCRRKRLPLLAWTVRTPEEGRLARARCDGMIFEAIRP